MAVWRLGRHPLGTLFDIRGHIDCDCPILDPEIPVFDCELLNAWCALFTLQPCEKTWLRPPEASDTDALLFGVTSGRLSADSAPVS